MKAEMLDVDTEYELAVAWRDHKDEDALHRLINAYMRLAISMASKFRRYGVSQLPASSNRRELPFQARSSYIDFN